MNKPASRYGRPLPVRARRPPPSFGALVGYVTCSYAELVGRGHVGGLAKALDELGVKSALEWRLVDHETGNRFIVYEYKSTTRYSNHPSALSLAALRRLPEFEWHISAGRFDLDALQRWMTERLGRPVTFRQ